MSTDTEWESSRSSDENCRATRCCSCSLHHICQRAAASPITLTSCSWTLTPLQNFGNKTQTSTGRRWGREKWSSGSLLCSVLFQFNLKACVLLVVPLRFSRQSQRFNEICTSICQIGFLTHLGHCTLELMLLSFSSGWQLKQREMFICLEVYIDMYLRNGKRSQNRPAFYCLSLC